MLLATAAHAAPGLPVVSACTGASLPASRLTNFLQTPIQNIVSPLQTGVNGLLALPIVGGILGGPLSIDVAGILNNAAAGQTIGLDVLTTNGTVLAPGSQCAQQASGFTLATDKGITIGGNSIDGLGTTGLNANAGEVNSIALGNNATTAAAATGAIAIGRNAAANTAGGVALGSGSVDKAATPTAGATIGGTAYTFAGANPTSVVSVGAAGAERQIANVAAGQITAASTDAVNGSQLFATNTAVDANTAAITTNTTNIAGNTTAITNLNNGTAGPVQQSGTPGRLVLVAPGATGAAPGAAQTLGNVAPGAVTAGSTDAVNGGQLAATNANVTTNTTNITNLTNGTAGLVQQATPTSPVTVAAASGGGSVDFTGTGGARVLNGVAPGVAATDAVDLGQVNGLIATSANGGPVQYSTAATPTTPNPGVVSNDTTLVGTAAGTPVGLHNVAAGALTPTSTDAVNGGQLAATNAQVGTNTTNIAGNTTAITNLSNGINNGTVGLVQQTGGSPGAGAITIGAATGGTSLNVGGTDGNRVISGVAAGVAPTDAANVGQLTGAIGTATANAVQYDTAGGVRTNRVTLAGGAAGPVTVTNVAPGTVAAGSTDAVNGGQLAATNAGVAANTTAITTNTANIAGNTTAIVNLNTGTAGTVQRTATPNDLVLTAPGGTGAAPGAAQVLSNVAAGVAPTDAVDLGQVNGLIAASSAAGPLQYSNPAAPTTPTPGVVSNDTTLVGTAPGTAVAVHNVAAGALTPTSTDAVNGSQLAATNTQVATNTTNIAGNTTAITNLNNGTAGLVQQTGGAPGNGQITVGAATGGNSVTIAGTGGNRTLTGLNAGVAGNDAVTVAQINGLTGNGLNNVQYDPAAGGGRSNTITLAGGTPGGVRITNVAAGALTPASTDAVNGGQLAATNTNVTNLTNGTAGAFQSNNAAGAAAPVASGANASAGGFGATATGAGAVALGNGAASTGTGSVALGQGSTDGGQARVVSVGSAGNERRVTNVGPAVNGTDAVNLAQLQTATNSFTTTTTGLQNQVTGLQGQLNQTNFDLNQVRRRANGGTAGAMAVAGLPQAFEPGKSMVGGAVGYWADQVAFAIGVSSIVGEHTVVKAGGSISNQGVGGFNAGIGFQF